MENQNLNILDEVNKGATMGMDAISVIQEKVQDKNFKQVLDDVGISNISTPASTAFPQISSSA